MAYDAVLDGTPADPAPISAQPSEPASASLLWRLAGPLCGIAVGAAVVGLAQTIALPAIEGQFSPRWWPQVSGAAIILFSLAAAVRALPADAPMEELEARQPGGVGRILASLGAVAAYGALWHWLDFRIVTVLLVAGLVAISGGRGWAGLVVFPVVVTTVLWVLFSLLLRVPV
ncbi:tripartite tricarboxylate transporter TctB family protein [Nesterenkonia sandarakina]|uniref:DUF1468 domain-containing protein n=1 Tax=Nesterenkonia sandarakina TaxID=272918 RepID=A0A7Z0EA39_9MICC|nr:tripartite tricarboxylate transporter TctB family protein [Nesterenkonia sandarakina]NYJ17147.1 hypothetical protein [Nesterenkonia sandarakina]